MKNKLKILVLIFALALVSTLSIYAATIFNSNTVSYNNNTSGMKSTNVQDAIDELYLATNSDCKLGYSKGETTSNSYTCNKDSEVTTSTINFNSSSVAYDNSNGMTATTVQGAIDELASRLSSRYCIDDYEIENEISTSYTCTKKNIIITFDANGGNFANNSATNVLTNFEAKQSEPTNIVKYSHTSNIDDTGLKLSDYGNDWSNANIAGTDRGDTSLAHVVTIPGANSLTVDIYYNSEDAEYDWATVWEGSHPRVSGGTKLGGEQSGSYIVNGNSLTSMGYSQFTINGDTVTFGFSSDETECGQGYGYYAMISGISIIATQTYNGTYEEPTRLGYIFAGWLSSTDGNVYKFYNISPSQNTTYTAQWEPEPEYCPNNETIAVASGAKCKRAISLHSAICNGGMCSYKVGNGNLILYGQCGIVGSNLSTGDALDCDVNGDGTFDAATERFYYVSDYFDTSAKQFESDTAVLIYYNNVAAGIPSNSTSFAYDLSHENWNGPVTALAQLPTTSQWSNVSLKNASRQILTETGTTSTEKYGSTITHTLPKFDYSGYAARLLTTQELEGVCNITEGDYSNDLNTGDYIVENTSYESWSIGSGGYWLETPMASRDSLSWNVSGYNKGVIYSSPSYYAENEEDIGWGSGVRPVIEVPKTQIAK